MADLDDPRPLARIPLADPDNPWLPNAVAATLARDPNCPRCPLSRTASTVCMAPVGTLGAPLVVLGSPTVQDDAAGKLMTSGVNATVIRAMKRHTGSFRVAWALSCPAGRAPTSANVDACRPYLAGEFAVMPPRAIVMGPVAAEGVTGVPYRAEMVRRAWARVRGVPCFFVMDPQRAAHNKHYLRWFEEDVDWAMTAPIEAAPTGEVRVLLSPEEAAAWFDGLVPGKPLAFDTEHWPKSPWAAGEFTLLCASFSQEVGSPVVVPGDVLAQPAARAALKRAMEDPRIPKVGHDIKHDRHALWRAFKIETEGMEWDTFKVAGLAESEAPKGLGWHSWQNGMGGYKAAGQLGADDEDDE